MSLETEACLALWRPQIKDLRIRIHIDNTQGKGHWSLVNRRTRKTLTTWSDYRFSGGPHRKVDERPEPEVELRTYPLSWLSVADGHLPRHHIEALLILKQELNDS